MTDFLNPMPETRLSAYGPNHTFGTLPNCNIPHPSPAAVTEEKKCRLGLSSPPEASEHNSVGEVQAGEMGDGGFVVAVVQEAEPGGAEEIAGAEVVDDVDLYRPASRILDQGKIISRPVCPAARWLPAAPIRPAWNWDRTNDIY